MIRLIELGELVCSPQSSIREVTRRMNAIPHLFQVVVNSDSNVLGTVTDGDIRRAILNDAQPDWAIGEYMNRSPLIGTLGRDGENRAALANGKVLFIPVIDDQKVLREIWVDTDQDIAISRALVMAGGYGRRLGEQTKKTPNIPTPTTLSPTCATSHKACATTKAHQQVFLVSSASFAEPKHLVFTWPP